VFPTHRIIAGPYWACVREYHLREHDGAFLQALCHTFAINHLPELFLDPDVSLPGWDAFQQVLLQELLVEAFCFAFILFPGGMLEMNQEPAAQGQRDC
jgi:hypothetical protein